MQRRQRLSAPDRRRQLLDVAGRLFAEVGFHNLSMAQLADGAGVSKPVLYQHFPSKRALHLAVVEDAVRELQARVGEALAGTADNHDRVHGAIAAYFDLVEDQRFRLLFGSAQSADEDVRALIDGALRGVADAVGRLIAEDAALSARAATFLSTALLGLATEGARWWVEHPQADKQEAVDLLARVVWRGLASFGAQRTPGATGAPGGPGGSTNLR